jgi:hypothetical protein
MLIFSAWFYLSKDEQLIPQEVALAVSSLALLFA